MSDATRQLVLVGNGDIHLRLAARAERLAQHDISVTLVTPEDFAFADWLGGMLGGEWQLGDVILPASRIAAHGGVHCDAEVSEIDRGRRRVTLTDRRTLSYDWLSIDLPSALDERYLPGLHSAPGAYTATAGDLWRLRQRLESQLANANEPLPTVAVIGSGPNGIELAANLLALGERYGRALPVTLIGNARRPLPGACRRANRWLMQRLISRGLRLEMVATATRFEAGQLILDDGTPVDAELVLIADPPSASPALARLGLVDDAERGMIDATLRYREDPHLFLPAAALPGQLESPTTRERAALLFASLEQAAAGSEARLRYPPGQRWKALNLGDLRDIAWWGPLWCRGRWVRRLKHRRDRREVARYLGS